jgi:hypothetical protein
LSRARRLAAIAAGTLALSWWAGVGAVTICSFGPCDPGPQPPPAGMPAANGWTLTTPAGRTAPRVASDADGDFVVVWLQRAAGADFDDTHVHAQRFSTLGVARGAAFRVDAWRATDAAVAMDADGDFVVAWTGEPQPDQGRRVFARLFGADGIARGPEFEVDAGGTGGALHVAAAMDVDGDFVLAWQDQGIHARRYDAAGLAQGAPFRVDTPATYAPNEPAVAMAAGGAFVIAWYTAYDFATGSDVRARRFDATGAAAGAEFGINEGIAGWQHYVTLAMDAAGNFIAAWNSGALFGDTDIVMRRFAADGTALSGDVVLASDVFSRPRAARSATGVEGIAWCTLTFGGGMTGQLFRTSTEFVFVMPESIGGCDAIAADADGDLTAVWANNGALEALRVGDHNRATLSVDVTEEADPVVDGASFRYLATITNTTAPTTPTGYPALDEAVGTANGIWLDVNGSVEGTYIYVNLPSTGLTLPPGASGQAYAEFLITGPNAAIEGAVGAAADQSARAEGPSHQTTIQGGTAIQFISAAFAADEATTAVVTVRRAGDLSAPSSVEVVAAAGTADAADFTPGVEPLQWAAGDASDRAVEIVLADDALVEGAETIALSLQNPAGATADTYGTATLTIRDDDPRQVTFAAAETRLGENDAPAAIVVKLSRATTEDITVPFTLLGTAATGLYTLSASPLTIPAGETEALLMLTPQDDARDDFAQGFAITLGEPDAGVLGAQREHHVTLLDDDAAPTASFTTAAQSVGEDAGTLSIPITLSSASDKMIRVGYQVSGSGYLDTTEPHPLSGQIEFAPGTTSGAITLTLADDASVESTEEIVLTLTNFTIGGTAWTAGAIDEHAITIEDNDVATGGGSLGFSSILLALAAFARRPRSARLMRATLLAAALCASGPVLAAETAPDCAALTDPGARLACYDEKHGKAAPAPGPAAAPTAAEGAAPAATPAADADRFGLARKPEPQDVVKSIKAHIVGAVKSWEKGTQFKLDNGQVWKVVDDGLRYYEGVPDNPEVTIERGLLGAFWMDIATVRPRVKVKRVS